MSVLNRSVARLDVVCPNHHDQVLANYCIGIDGDEWTTDISGYRAESVAAPGTIDSMKRAMTVDPNRPMLGLPVAEAAPGEEPHTRGRFSCPRPSCNYDGQIRSTRLWAGTTAVLRWQVAHGVELVTIQNIESSEAEASQSWAQAFGWAAIASMDNPPVGRVVSS